MISIKRSKIRLVNAIFGCFFGILGLILPLFASQAVFAEEPEVNTPAITETTTTETTEEEQDKKDPVPCNDSLGSIGWLVCPTTGKISEAVDFLYKKNKNLLEINPVRTDDGSGIFEVWNYCLGIANIAFVIFLLIAIYSQITGVGISNYGIKKALPKLIIAAIMVNLSFLVCSLAVDTSNIIGNGLRGFFNNVSESVVIPSDLAMLDPNSLESRVTLSQTYQMIELGEGAGGVAAGLAFEGGEIWLLIPAALAALVAVAIGLVTIALRQVVVILLVMIAPLAIVAYILPNTEKYFNKWKDLFVKMLVFYPLYSLLFGASSLAGWAIIASAHDGFGLILGIAVQIFPLFFSWSLMKMSGTFLGTINAKLTGIFAKPLATNQAWAESHRELTRQKFLASNNVYTPTLRLRQFLSDRKIAREAEIKENADLVKKRGEYYATRLNYNKDGSVSKEGAEAYKRIIRARKYQNYIDNSKADFDKGLGSLEVTKRSNNLRMREKLNALDEEAMNAFDEAEIVSARAEMIDYKNKKSRQERLNAAMNAHMDDMNGQYLSLNSEGVITPMDRSNYKLHMARGSNEYKDAIARYNRMAGYMEGDKHDTQYALASVTNSYDVAKKVYDTKFQKMFDYTVPTRDVEHRLNELSKHMDALKNVDAIIAGMRVLNQRGDTDLVKNQLDNVLEHGVKLGTHVSQALASFLMFEVKDNDPFLRRFGKYINLETANMYNSNNRKEANVTYEEYVKGYHEEPDGKRMYAKKDMNKLVEGTSLDNIERTTFGNLDASLQKAYGWNGKEWTDPNGFKKYLMKRKEIQTAIEPAFLSAGLKWPSGSEQMNSAVKFWMGYENRQMKDAYGNVIADDKYNEPVYTTTPIWKTDPAFKGHEDEAIEFFCNNSCSWMKDQTTNQALNIRTDVRDPLVENMVEKYLRDNPELADQYYKEKKAIESKHYDNDPSEDRIKRADALARYKRRIASEPITKILGESGKLKTMLNLTRSSALANTKDWAREMYGLDDYYKLKEKVDHYEQIRKEKKEAENPNKGSDSDDNTYRGPYDEAARAENVSQMEQIWDDYGDTDEFYDRSVEGLDSIFPENGGKFIRRAYKKYHKDHPNAPNIELWNYLKGMLNDPDCYDD